MTGPTDDPDDADPRPLGSLLATRLQRLEIALLARVLATTLAEALPPSMVEVQRRRGLADRLSRTPAHVAAITVRAGDQHLHLRSSDDGRVDAVISHVVRGVVLARRTVPLAAWLVELGAVLDLTAAADEATRRALRRALVE